jgi:tRNA G37 N-methylase Trm5
MAETEFKIKRIIWNLPPLSEEMIHFEDQYIRSRLRSIGGNMHCHTVLVPFDIRADGSCRRPDLH